MAKSRSAATADRQGASFKVEAPRWWRAELDTFLKRHPDWGSRLAAVEPVYGLPSAAVEALVSRRRPLLDPPRAAAERDFNDLLARSVAIGVWQNAPVRGRTRRPSPASTGRPRRSPRSARCSAAPTTTPSASRATPAGS
jgi:hypothetical protein